MEVETVPTSSLKEDTANARTHDERNLDAIKGSLKAFGQVKPIIVDSTGTVIAGNGTLRAAIALGWSEIAVIRTSIKDAKKRAAYALSDNRTAELAAWDDAILTDTLRALKDDGFDIESIGFDGFDLSLPPEDGLTDPDEVPEVTETRCKKGDLWLLGKHRVLCGDSTKLGDVERLMGGEKADMVFTDPPYGMHLDTDYSSQRNSDGRHSGKAKNAPSTTYTAVIGDDQDFDPSFLLERFKDAREHFWFGADYYRKSLPDGGSWVVWDKRTPAASETNFDAVPGSCFELCWSREKHKRDIARILHCGLYSVENDKRQHPTQKPVALAAWFFEHWGKSDDLVADLFLGSGSTLIACEKTGRRCFGMEIDEHYCDVIVTRWENFTGKKATRDSVVLSA